MKTTKNLLKGGVAITVLLCLTAFGEPKTNTKSEGHCKGSKSCKICHNGSRYDHRGAIGICGVCSPESFEVKKAKTKRMILEQSKKLKK